MQRGYERHRRGKRGLEQRRARDPPNALLMKHVKPKQARHTNSGILATCHRLLYCGQDLG